MPGLVIADLDLAAAQQVAIEAKALATNANFRAEALHVDITLPESVDDVVKKTVGSLERIDYCVICAGVSF